MPAISFASKIRPELSRLAHTCSKSSVILPYTPGLHDFHALPHGTFSCGQCQGCQYVGKVENEFSYSAVAVRAAAVGHTEHLR